MRPSLLSIKAEWNEATAADPEASAEVLYRLATFFPATVLGNPALPLITMEKPELGLCIAYLAKVELHERRLEEPVSRLGGLPAARFAVRVLARVRHQLEDKTPQATEAFLAAVAEYAETGKKLRALAPLKSACTLPLASALWRAIIYEDAERIHRLSIRALDEKMEEASELEHLRVIQAELEAQEADLAAAQRGDP